MHKIFLTDPETSIIHGADKIIAEFGGFPSMENGKLCSVTIKESSLGYARYDIFLMFDVEKWAIDSSDYVDIPKSSYKFIELSFLCARNISINRPLMHDCGEIKFGNTFDRRKMYQDSLPQHPIVIDRPFCTFYIKAGRDFVIEFDECECQISAAVKDNF